MKKSSKHIPTEEENSLPQDQEERFSEEQNRRSFFDTITGGKKQDADAEDSFENRLTEAEKQKEEIEDRLLRTLAEFENYKKRISREKEDIGKYGIQKFAQEILPVIDNFERALQQAKQAEEMTAVVEGLEMILKQLLSVLEKFDITPIDSLGEPFNPEHHEAMAQHECDDESDDNTIIEEFQKGYFMGDRLLRPSRVVVAKKKGEPDN